jgi:hypothetical protein
MDRECSMPCAKTTACRVLVEKPVRKRQLRGTTCRWKDNIKIDLRETGKGLWTEFICTIEGHSRRSEPSSFKIFWGIPE